MRQSRLLEPAGDYYESGVSNWDSPRRRRCIFITEASEQFTSAAIMCAKDMIDLIL